MCRTISSASARCPVRAALAGFHKLAPRVRPARRQFDGLPVPPGKGGIGALYLLWSIFGSSNGGVAAVSYAGWEVEVGEIDAATSEWPGEFSTMLIKLSGPQSLLGTLNNFQIGDPKLPVIQKNGPFSLLPPLCIAS